MSIKNSECWATDASARALRVELPDGKTLLLRHDHFLYAEFETKEDEQYLQVFFTTHEVQIRGHCLRRIETALQRGELSQISTVPTHWQKSINDNQPIVSSIVVVEPDATN